MAAQTLRPAAARPVLSPAPLAVGRPGLQNGDLGQLSRRVKRFRRMGMLEPRSGPGLSFKRATSLDELRAAYRLVHNVYVQNGYITPQPGDLRLRVFEALPEMATFIALDRGQVVGVMSVLPDSPTLGLPSDQAFPAELAQLRAEGRRLGETTNLAVDSRYRNTNVFFELSRYCTAHGKALGLDDLFIAVSPGHSTFFEGILQCDPYGERRDCGAGNLVDIVVGKRLNLQTFEPRLRRLDHQLSGDAFLHDWFYRTNPYLGCPTHDDITDRFLNPDLLRRLLAPVDHTITWSESQRRALHHHWADALMRYVFPTAEAA